MMSRSKRSKSSPSDGDSSDSRSVSPVERKIPRRGMRSPSVSPPPTPKPERDQRKMKDVPKTNEKTFMIGNNSSGKTLTKILNVGQLNANIRNDPLLQQCGLTDNPYLGQFGVKDVINEKKTTYYQYEDMKPRENMMGQSAKKKKVGSDLESGSSSSQCEKELKRQKSNESILSKVNEIIKSCVKLKEDKQISGEKLEKANLIIEKAKEKERKILQQLEKKIDLATSTSRAKMLEEGEITESEFDDNESRKNILDILTSKVEESNQSKSQRIVHVIRKQNNPKPSKPRSKSKSTTFMTRSASKSRSRSPRSKSRSRSRSWSRGRSVSRGRSDSRRRWRSPSRRSSRSRSRSRYRFRGRGTHYMVSRSRSRSRGRTVQQKKTWIAVSPCVIMDNLTLEEDTKRKITVVQKDQYYFPCNAGCMVKITKWTGQDHVGGIHVSQQTVTLEDKRDIDVVVENPYEDRQLKLEKLDKIACLSILSAPIPRFSNSLSPDRYVLILDLIKYNDKCKTNLFEDMRKTMKDGSK